MDNEISEKIVEEIIKSTIHEINSDLGIDIVVDNDTELLSENSPYSSMSIVRLIIGIEENLFDTYRTSITIADEKAMSYAKSPLKTVGVLTKYIVELLKNEETA